jgi:hypothetical protein
MRKLDLQCPAGRGIQLELSVFPLLGWRRLKNLAPILFHIDQNPSLRRRVIEAAVQSPEV